jgi:hypothetical protein
VANLFGRAFRLIVGTTEIDARAGALDNGLRVAFAINRDEKRTPNNAEIRVWNMSPDDRAKLAKASSISVSLEAGYVDDVGQIFLGDLRSARSHKEPNGDIVTTICGGDGETAIRTARISRTFSAGTPVATVLKALASALGCEPGNSAAAAARLGAARLSKARTLSGLCYDELEAFCRTQGLRWSVQDSALQIREEGEPVQPTTGPLLRNDSGLVGELEVERNATVSRSGKKKGTVVSGSCLLRADLIPGVAFRVESEPTFSGALIATQTLHRGDSATSEWHCDWSGKPYG